MKKIPLKNIKKEIINYALIDDEDFEWLNKYRWCINSQYASRTSRFKENQHKQKAMYMAIEIMKEHNLYNKNKEIDHINRNKLDNRKCNLRMATKSQNGYNIKFLKNNTSGYKGVFRNSNIGAKKRWRAMIQIEKKRIFLGCFSSAIEAAKAYDKAALKHHKEFANLNFNN